MKEHSPLTLRRLRDGERAYARIAEEPKTFEQKRELLEVLGDGVGAMQSLDDLGSDEENREAMRKHDAIMKRWLVLKRELGEGDP